MKCTSQFSYRGSRFLIATLSLQNHPIWLAPPSNDWSNPRQIQDSYNLIAFEEGRLFGELITAPPPKSSRLFARYLKHVIRQAG